MWRPDGSVPAPPPAITCRQPNGTILDYDIGFVEGKAMREWMTLIASEYQEMPGLRLTKTQVRRLWTLETQMCDAILERLVAARVLEKTSRDEYVLAGTTSR